MFDDLKPLLILSPQRTGSTFLTNYLHAKFYADKPIYRPDQADDKIGSGKLFVAQSHSLYSPEQIENSTVIFSVRRSIVDMVLSRLIADNGYGDYQFEAKKHLALEYLLLQERWYVYYDKLLNPNSNVVIYEVLQDICPHLVQSTVDKKTIIVNYDETVDFLSKNISSAYQRCHNHFCDYAARLYGQNIYKLLN